MIVTLTANPSLDRTVTLDGALVPGRVHRIATDCLEPGGKGINVARGLAGAGLDVLAVFPADPEDPLLDLVRRHGLPHRSTPLGAQVRTNLTVVSTPQVTTKINEPGPWLSEEAVESLTAAVLASVSGPGDCVMMSGSLAPGTPDDQYARMVRVLRGRGAWVGVDTSDAPLAALVAAGPAAAPDLLTPNAEELGQVTGRDGAALEASARAGDLSQVLDAAARLREGGVGAVLVTLGAAGAVLVTTAGAWFAPSPDRPVVSTVGAGDSAVAGYLIARAAGADGPARLALSVAYGAEAVSLPGTGIPSRDQVRPDLSAVTVL